LRIGPLGPFGIPSPFLAEHVQCIHGVEQHLLWILGLARVGGVEVQDDPVRLRQGKRRRPKVIAMELVGPAWAHVGEGRGAAHRAQVHVRGAWYRGQEHVPRPRLPQVA